MKYFYIVFRVELFKTMKAKITWLTLAAFTIAPLMAGFFMFVLKNPDLAENIGLLSAKAQLAGEATWPSYLQLHAQIIAVGGIFVFGLIVSWIFGREYADRTITDLLALPHGRSIIVIAKFLVSSFINFLLSLYIISLGLVIGWVIKLPEWSIETLFSDLRILGMITFLTILLSTPAAFFASYGKGYLAPLGFIMFMLVLSQIITIIGYGEYFPWSIPAVYSGLMEEGSIQTKSFLIVLSISLLGVFSTIYQWEYVDQY